ncbi:MAG: hypothetical protein ACLR78_13855 [Roseburia sp.]
MHMVVNRVPGGGTSAIIQTVWRKYGKNVHFTPLYEDGDYKNLAEYITKPLKEEEISGQLTLFGEEEDRKIFSAYSCSKGLESSHSRKNTCIEDERCGELVENGPEPTPGYYIDREQHQIRQESVHRDDIFLLYGNPAGIRGNMRKEGR